MYAVVFDRSTNEVWSESSEYFDSIESTSSPEDEQSINNILTSDVEHETSSCPTPSAATALPDSNKSNSIHLRGIKSTQSRCFVCHSTADRSAVPWAAIQQAWFGKLCYIPKLNRACKEHLTLSDNLNEEALQKIEEMMEDVYVGIDEFQLWFISISDLPNTNIYNFEEDGIEASKYKILLGISKENFDDLVQYLHGTYLVNISGESTI